MKMLKQHGECAKTIYKKPLKTKNNLIALGKSPNTLLKSLSNLRKPKIPLKKPRQVRKNPKMLMKKPRHFF
jgi:hypothetical protein